MSAAIEGTNGTDRKKAPERKDTRALWWGLAFSVLFTALIWGIGYRLQTFELLPDAGTHWYYWKLPQPTWLGRISAWGLYIIHQVAFWGLIWYGQTRVKTYTNGLHRVNIMALGLNALFIVLHLVQTHIWYDGLAQDVSIASSQYSVVALLVWVVLMENARRGVFLGKRLPISQRVIRWARKYHGYFFSWAIIYTFWFHPMESTSGHLIGFFYMFMIMLQGSLFFTRVHTNKYWTFALEFMVLIHGTLVAIDHGAGKWPQFLFGFAGVVVLTLIYGLPIKRWLKWGITALYIAGVIATYTLHDMLQIDPGRAPRDLTIIPITYYAGVIVLALVIWLGWWTYDRFHPAEKTPAPISRPETS